MHFKGYICYKNITSENIVLEALFKNILISSKSYVSFLTYSFYCIWNHSWWISVHQLKRIFGYIFSNVDHFVTKLAQLIAIFMSCISKKYFAWLGGVGLKSRRFLTYEPFSIDQKPIMASLVLCSVESEHWDNKNY